MAVEKELSLPNVARNKTHSEVHDPIFYYTWISCSLISCLLIHHVLSPYIFTRFNKVYRSLPLNRRMEWDSRVVSSIHATIVSIMCVSTLWSETELWQQPINHVSHRGLLALSISVGYFVCDLVSMPIYWWGRTLVIFTFHHLAATIAFVNVVIFRSCIFFGIYRLTTELSTPFTNQRWFYRTVGYKPDRRRVASVTLLFSIFFAITRILMIGPFWLIAYWAKASPSYKRIVIHVPLVDLIFCLSSGILDVLNIYWSFKTYAIGRKAAHILWSADWQTDIRRARAKFHYRLRRVHRRIPSECVPKTVPSDLAVGIASVKGDVPGLVDTTPSPLLSPTFSSSSSYSSDTEYEAADDDLTGFQEANNMIPGGVVENQIAAAVEEIADDLLLTHRTVADPSTPS